MSEPLVATPPAAAAPAPNALLSKVPAGQVSADPAKAGQPKVGRSILESVSKVRTQAATDADASAVREQDRRLTPPAPAAAVVAKPPAPVTTDPAPPPTNDKEINLSTLRKGKEEADARVKQLEAELQETRGRIPTDYDKLKSENGLLISEIELRDVTASPRFKEKYDAPMEAHLGQIKKTLALTDAKTEEFLSIVQMPESKERNLRLAEMMEGIDRVSGGKIETALSQYDALRDQRAGAMTDPKTAWQETQREQQERLKQAQQRQNAAMDSALKEAGEKIPWFKTVEGNDAWNQKVTSTQQRARDFWSGKHSTDELAQLTLAGAMAPLFGETITQLATENERLNKENAELRGAKPQMRAGSSSGAAAGGNNRFGGHRSLGELMRAKANGQ